MKYFVASTLAIIFSSCQAFTPTMKGAVYIALTVDGYIAAPDGDVEFLTPFQQSADDDMGFQDFMESIDVLIMGRKSFEKVLSFGQEAWPYGNTPVTVWTRNEDSLKIPAFCKATVSCSSLAPSKMMEELEMKGYKKAYIDGGTTVNMFLNEHQIHEMILTRVPILLGKGISLFRDTEQVSLEHVTTKAYKNGLVMSHYRVKGEEGAGK